MPTASFSLPSVSSFPARSAAWLLLRDVCLLGLRGSLPFSEGLRSPVQLLLARLPTPRGCPLYSLGEFYSTTGPFVPVGRGGLLIINFDEAGAAILPNPSGGFIVSFDGAFCCNQQPGPNLGAFPQSSQIGSFTLSFKNYGGDRTGAVLLSPFLKPGTVSNVPFNHYSLLKTVEDIFDLDEHLGYAGQPGLLGFFGCVSPDVPLKDGDRS